MNERVEQRESIDYVKPGNSNMLLLPRARCRTFLDEYIARRKLLPSYEEGRFCTLGASVKRSIILVGDGDASTHGYGY